MSFKKPFRAVPIRLGERYRREQRRSERIAAVRFLGIAAALGAFIGIGTVAMDQDGRTTITSALKPLAVQAGLARARQPQPRDRWGGCNDARAAGTAPIYSGEPGYREDMDGNGDGVACEPYR